MRITVRQLKGLIREAAEEAMEEMKHEGEDPMMEQDDSDEAYEEKLQEAVAKAFRAGYRKGRAAKR